MRLNRFILHDPLTWIFVGDDAVQLVVRRTAIFARACRELGVSGGLAT